MKSLCIRFGVWLLRPVVERLVDERMEKESAEASRELREFLDETSDRMGHPEWKSADKQPVTGTAT